MNSRFQVQGSKRPRSQAGLRGLPERLTFWSGLILVVLFLLGGMSGAGVRTSNAGDPSAAPLTWASLGDLRPLLIQQSIRLTGQALTVDSGNLVRIAYCAPGGIQLSNDGGASWSLIATDQIVQLAAGSGFPLLYAEQTVPACTALLPDPNHPDSYFVTFAAGKAPYGAPPLFFLGFFTTDAGQTWQVAPVPDGYSIEQFGGFQPSDAGVQILYGNRSSFAVEATDDGGATWSLFQRGCPAAGPCVRWGPAPTGIGSCAMNAHPQPVFSSSDGGTTWLLPAGHSGANGCGSNELAALSDTAILLLSGRDEDPVSLSIDGGQTWQPLTLPSIPNSYLPHPSFPGLQILPDGSLMARDRGSWWRLQPESRHWCQLDKVPLPTLADIMPVSGDMLWWLEISDSLGQPPQPQHTSLHSIQCEAAPGE
ncbi:MAG: hypothetical protein ACR2PL_04535 [Dehalococcoidia bacterium]